MKWHQITWQKQLYLLGQNIDWNNNASIYLKLILEPLRQACGQKVDYLYQKHFAVDLAKFTKWTAKKWMRYITLPGQFMHWCNILDYIFQGYNHSIYIKTVSSERLLSNLLNSSYVHHPKWMKLNSFLLWIVVSLEQLSHPKPPKKNRCRDNYSRKYGSLRSIWAQQHAQYTWFLPQISQEVKWMYTTTKDKFKAYYPRYYTVATIQSTTSLLKDISMTILLKHSIAEHSHCSRGSTWHRCVVWETVGNGSKLDFRAFI